MAEADVRLSPAVTAIEERATAMAAELGHRAVKFEHWLLAILDDEQGSAVLTAAGADVDALRAELVSRLPRGMVVAESKQRFLAALQTAFAAAGKSEITPGDLLHLMLRARRVPIIRYLAAQGVEVVDVLNVLAHGIRRPAPRSRVRELIGLPRAWLVRPPAPVTATRWNVVAHDDDYTPRELVEALLVRIFEKDAPEASALTQRIHAEGRAVIGTYTHRRATKKAHAATLEAHAKSYPFRLSLEPAD